MDKNQITKTLGDIQSSVLPLIASKVIATCLLKHGLKENEVEKLWRVENHEELGKMYSLVLEKILNGSGLIREGYKFEVRCSEEVGAFNVKIYKSSGKIIMVN